MNDALSLYRVIRAEHDALIASLERRERRGVPRRHGSAGMRRVITIAQRLRPRSPRRAAAPAPVRS